MKRVVLKNISKSFIKNKNNDVVIKDITFSLEEGKIIALLGKSGCGKSTILNIISGLIKEDMGNVKVFGKLGYMFQHDLLLDYLNVYDNIILGVKINKEEVDDALVDKLLKQFDLFEYKYASVKSLSGGMAQRVALIRTLVTKPDILLLDEPFSALDSRTRISVCNDVYKVIKENNLSAILVTHDILEAIAFSDEVYILSNNPSTIVEKYNINIMEKSLIERRLSDKAKNLFLKIWRDHIETS